MARGAPCIEPTPASFWSLARAHTCLMPWHASCMILMCMRWYFFMWRLCIFNRSKLSLQSGRIGALLNMMHWLVCIERGSGSTCSLFFLWCYDPRGTLHRTCSCHLLEPCARPYCLMPCARPYCLMPCMHHAWYLCACAGISSCRDFVYLIGQNGIRHKETMRKRSKQNFAQSFINTRHL
jgi:hypothetical protein